MSCHVFFPPSRFNTLSFIESCQDTWNINQAINSWDDANEIHGAFVFQNSCSPRKDVLDSSQLSPPCLGAKPSHGGVPLQRAPRTLALAQPDSKGQQLPFGMGTCETRSGGRCELMRLGGLHHSYHFCWRAKWRRTTKIKWRAFQIRNTISWDGKRGPGQLWLLFMWKKIKVLWLVPKEKTWIIVSDTHWARLTVLCVPFCEYCHHLLSTGLREGTQCCSAAEELCLKPKCSFCFVYCTHIKPLWI